MSSRRDEFKGLWRASANEAVPYTDDFPEALLVTPEFWDGSTKQGNASEILHRLEWINDNQVKLTIRDNGKGIQNERRLLTWAAAVSADLTHQNGHGLKKALTKYSPNFETAQWKIRYRRKNKNLQVISAPFLGPDTKSEEVEGDEVTLMPSGTEIEVIFEAKVLGKNGHVHTPDELLYLHKELITTRYSDEHLQNTKFTVQVKKGSFERSISSFNSAGERVWFSFKKHIEDMVKNQTGAIHLKTQEQEIQGGRWITNFYYITPEGSTNYPLKERTMFPFYGRKNQNTSRVFIALNGRVIEAYEFYKFMEAEAPHNNFNGILGFVNFIPDDAPDAFKFMPTPATTKVSFYENCPIFVEFCKKIIILAPSLYEGKKKYKEEEKAKEIAQAKAAAEAERKRLAEEEALRKAKAEVERKRLAELEAAKKAKEKLEKEQKAREDAVRKAKEAEEAARKAKLEKFKLPDNTSYTDPVDLSGSTFASAAGGGGGGVKPTEEPAPSKSAAQKLVDLRMKREKEEKEVLEKCYKKINEYTHEQRMRLLTIMEKHS